LWFEAQISEEPQQGSFGNEEKEAWGVPDNGKSQAMSSQMLVYSKFLDFPYLQAFTSHFSSSYVSASLPHLSAVSFWHIPSFPLPYFISALSLCWKVHFLGVAMQKKVVVLLGLPRQMHFCQSCIVYIARPRYSIHKKYTVSF
jgi:hypothetical protein